MIQEYFEKQLHTNLVFNLLPLSKKKKKYSAC